jgi:hypothetical protein
MTGVVRLRSFVLLLAGVALVGSEPDAIGLVAGYQTGQLPTVDAVLEKYVDSLGGRAALEHHTSRLMKGTYAIPTKNYSTSVEAYAKAPDRFAFHMTGKGSTASRGFNGTVGWSRDFAEQGLRLLDGPPLDADRFEADFYQPLHWRQRYATMTVTGMDTSGERPAFTIDASSPSSHETMYFDADSGLLVRRDVPRYRGFERVQVYFDNYRAAGDIKLPVTIRIVSTDRAFMNIFTFDTIVNDARIDDAKFNPPRVR